MSRFSGFPRAYRKYDAVLQKAADCRLFAVIVCKTLSIVGFAKPANPKAQKGKHKRGQRQSCSARLLLCAAPYARGRTEAAD